MKYLPFIFLVITACSNPKNSPLRIAASANTAFALNEIIDSFESDSNTDCELIIASSGKLTAQILEGAPFHVFVSADTLHPLKVQNNGKTIGKVYTFAEGSLSLWSKVPVDKSNWKDLLNNSSFKIAIAKPELAPYGLAAEQVMENLKIEKGNRIIMGESISQVNQFIVTESVDLAFTATSVAWAPHMKSLGYWMNVPKALHSPIIQGAIVIKQDSHLELAEEFLNYLHSPKAIEILQKYGYETQ